MKKGLKIVGITLLSLLGVILVSAAILIWVVFTPQRLTSIVKKEADRFISCETVIERVELTLFSTFPKFSIEVENLALINPMEGAPSDTVAFISDFAAAINIRALIKEKTIIVDKVYLNGGFANIYSNASGEVNYNVFKLSSSSSSAFKLPILDVSGVSIEGLDLLYKDEKKDILARIDKLNTKINLKNLPPEAAQGRLNLSTPSLYAKMGERVFSDTLSLSINAPFALKTDTIALTLKEASLSIEGNALYLDGYAKKGESKDIELNMYFETGEWVVGKIIEIAPKFLLESIKDISTDGVLKMKGNAVGVLNDTLKPLVNVDILYKEATASHRSLPYKLEDLNFDIKAFLDLNKKTPSFANISSLSAKTGKTKFSISGKANDILGNIKYDVLVKGKINLPDLKHMLPDSLPVSLKGEANASIKAIFDMAQFKKKGFDEMNINGSISFSDLDVVYQDTTSVYAPNLNMKFGVADKRVKATFDIASLDCMMGKTLYAELLNADIKVDAWDLLNNSKIPNVKCDFALTGLSALKDTINIAVYNPKGSVTISPSAKGVKIPKVLLNYYSESLYASLGEAFSLDTKSIKVDADANYDKSLKGFFAQFDPKLNVDFRSGYLTKSDMALGVEIPNIVFDFEPECLNIKSSRIILGDSDFNLSGQVTNIPEYLDKTGLLTADLKFVSANTNIDQMMELFSGFGSEEKKTEGVKTKDASEINEDNPFMVPLGIDFRLNTSIKSAKAFNNNIEKVRGNVTVKDGVIVLEQVGFTSEAARMQLTAIYKSARKNHLFLGLDFHLLDIQIDKLIKMIPDIDTIVPMLKSFQGKAQFHLAAETYLKSNYELKMSTLRGAAALEGKDLVVLNSDTFSQISNLLMFDKKSKNVIDTLSVEMGVYKNEVDIYPFFIKMDQYKAIISGRHNLDMTFDYHIDCWIPTRLGLDIKGKPGDMKYKLAPTKYANLFIPEKRNITQQQVIELKKIIGESLKANVKEVE